MDRSKRAQMERRRECAREIVIVTLGVLIALGIGEIADAIRWEGRVRTSMAAIRVDLGAMRYDLNERIVLQPCLEEKLEMIAAVIKQARRTNQLPEVQGLAKFPMRKMEFANWEVAKVEGITLHMSRDEAVSLGHIYSGLESFPGASNGPEMRVWSRLMAMEDAPGPIDSALLAEFTMAYQEAKTYAYQSKVIAEQIDADLAQRGIPIRWADNWPSDSRNRDGIKSAMVEWGVCTPLSIDNVPFRASQVRPQV